MWLLNALPRFFIAICVLGLLSLLLPAEIDLAAKTDTAERKESRDPCDKLQRSERADRGDSDEESDDGDAEDSDLDGDDDDDEKNKKKRLRDCDPPASAGVARGDFNADGIADLAVGVPFEDEDGVGSVGAVNVIYGTADGLKSTGDQYLTSVTFGFPYAANDHFGAAVASGDFNGDGFSDLAIGMPGRARGLDADHGRVVVIDGSSTGLLTSTARSLIPIFGGENGAALAWGDFNADGIGDLAVGVPGYDTFACFDRGGVLVYFGEETGRFGDTDGDGLNPFVQFIAGFDCNERTGAPLAAGDFDGDGASDLVVGVPLADSDDFLGPGDAGEVHLWRGGTAEPRLGQVQFMGSLHQDVGSVASVREAGDHFGFALAVGNFNGDGREDLAVGVPFEDLGSAVSSGAVHVFLGGGGELLDVNNDLFFDQANLGEERESGDSFGRALAAADFNDDGFDDLAIGSPSEDIVVRDAGMVSVVRGSSTGISLTDPQHWHLFSAGISGGPVEGDSFGRALSAWNYGKSRHRDLAIGVPFRDLLSVNTNTMQANAGVVYVLYGSSTGLTATGSEVWHQDVSGIGSAASSGDRFGVALY